MGAVTTREAGPDLASLIEEVQGGRDVILTRDGVPVAWVVKEAVPRTPGKRVLTPRQQVALERSMAILERGWPLGVGDFDRNEIHAERLMRQHKPWRD